MSTIAGNYHRRQTTGFALFSIFIVGSLLLVLHFDWIPVGFILWFLLLIVGLFAMISRHAKMAAYLCPVCEQIFAISRWADFLSPQIGAKKLLKCTGCGVASWCREMRAGETVTRINNMPIPKKEINRAGTRRWLYIQVGMVVIAYLIFWANALHLHSKLPDVMLTHFVISDALGCYAGKSAVLALPALAALFPLLHGLFLIYAARQGYRSIVYPIFTGVVVAVLAVFGAVQYRMLAPMVF